MTLPSTEELQRLLDETPHETWRAEIDEGNDWWNVVPSRFGGHTPIAEGMSQPVAELTAESRALAAEVIRLREATADAKSRLDDYVDAYHKQGQFYTSARLRNVSKDLALILEGDQA